MSKITAQKVTKFLWKNVVCRYGVPRVIITDHGPQFDCNLVRDFCTSLCIDLCFSSVAHPRSNGQVENVNARILGALNKRLQGAKGLWAEHLTLVLWDYHTTVWKATGATPFSLLYGTEVVLPVEKLVPSPLLIDYDEAENAESLRMELHLREERRMVAAVKMAEFKRRSAGYYNKRVKARGFSTGDLVLRRMEGGKLDPKWKEPYMVDKEVAPGAYKIRNCEGEVLAETWNACRLKKFYP